MTVHFDTALVDLIAMRRYVRKHTRGLTAIRVILHLLALFVGLCVLIIARYQFNFEWPQLLLLMIALAFLYHVAMRSGTDDRGAVTRSLQRGLLPGVLGPTAVTLEEECIVVQRLVRSERIAWAGFVGIAQTNDHLLLFESDLVGVVIPRRAFENSEEFLRFAEEVRRLHRQTTAAATATV